MFYAPLMCSSFASTHILGIRLLDPIESKDISFAGGIEEELPMVIDSSDPSTSTSAPDQLFGPEAVGSHVHRRGYMNNVRLAVYRFYADQSVISIPFDAASTDFELLTWSPVA